jgi:hypothetical protein
MAFRKLVAVLQPVFNKALKPIAYFSVVYAVGTSLFSYTRTAEKLAAHFGFGQAILAHIGLITFMTVYVSFLMLIISGVSLLIVLVLAAIFEWATKITVPDQVYLVTFIPAAVAVAAGDEIASSYRIICGVGAFALILGACYLIDPGDVRSRSYSNLLLTGAVTAGAAVTALVEITDRGKIVKLPGGNYDLTAVWLGAFVVAALAYLVVQQAKAANK